MSIRPSFTGSPPAGACAYAIPASTPKAARANDVNALRMPRCMVALLNKASGKLYGGGSFAVKHVSGILDRVLELIAQHFAWAQNPVVLARQMLAGVSTGMLLFLISAGLSLIFGVLRILNFSHA